MCAYVCVCVCIHLFVHPCSSRRKKKKKSQIVFNSPGLTKWNCSLSWSPDQRWETDCPAGPRWNWFNQCPVSTFTDPPPPSAPPSPDRSEAEVVLFVLGEITWMSSRWSGLKTQAAGAAMPLVNLQTFSGVSGGSAMGKTGKKKKKSLRCFSESQTCYCKKEQRTLWWCKKEHWVNI